MASHKSYQELGKVRAARVARGISQVELARRAGISRQALGAIESGLYQPSVAVALRLARELGQTVERLFAPAREEICLRLEARFEGEHVSSRTRAHPHVALGRVAGKIVALRQSSPRLALPPAAGLIEAARRHRAGVATYHSQDEIDSTLLVAGCDPAVTLLADWLARQRSPARLVAVPCSSSLALRLLIDRSVHAAGAHMKDTVGGEYNLAAARRALGNQRAMMVNFARWEIGLATAPANPLGLRGFDDLQRPKLRIANRERGSGARATLDDALRKSGLSPHRLLGYRFELNGHLEVAAAIAAGLADTGVTLRVAADAYHLGFVALREERYDLVVSESDSGSPPLIAMLEALNSGRFARQVTQFCAYDTSQMGRLITQFN